MRERTDQDGQRRADRTKQLFAAAAGGLILLIGAAALAWRLYEWRWERRLRARVAELRAAGEPVTVEEVLARREPPPPDENLALVLMKAFEQAEGLAVPYSLPIVHRLVSDVQIGRRWSAPLTRAVGACLAPYGPAIRTAEQAAELEHGAYPPEDPIATYGQHQARLADLAWVCWLRAAAVIAQGPPSDGKRAAVLCGRLASSLGDDPFLHTVMRRRTLDARFVNAAERLLAYGEPPPDDMAGLRAELRRELDAVERAEVVRAERALGHEELLQQSEPGAPGPGWRSRWQELAARASRGTSAWRHRDVLAWHEGLDRIAALAALPPDEQLRRLRALEADPAVVPPAPWSAVGSRLRRLLSNLQREVRSRTVLRVADAALAVELYRLREGRWPDSLEDLTPDLLAQVPRDPFSGRSLRYRRTGWGAVVYSVGADAADDGGLPRHEANKRAGPGSHVMSGFDIPFRLLDPGRRGAPPASFADEVMRAGVTRRELEVAGLDEEELARLGVPEADLARLGFGRAHESAARFAP